MRKGNPFVGYHPELLPRKHQYPTPEEVARAEWEGVEVAEPKEIEQRRAAMARGESPMFVPLSDLTSDQIREMKRSQFTNAEWDELDEDDREHIEDHDDESQERVDALAQPFLDAWKWGTTGDQGRSADEELEYYFEDWLRHRADRLYEEMPSEHYDTLIEYGRELGLGDETVDTAINEVMADTNNYSFDFGERRGHSSIYSVEVKGSIYMEFDQWEEPLAAAYPDEVERAINKVNKETYLSLDEDDVIPKPGRRYHTFEVNDLDTDTYAHANVDWESIESLVRQALDDIEVPDDADAPGAPTPDERVVYKWPDGFYVQDLLPSELPAEGKAMGMCVGRPDMGYGKAVRNGEIKILSVRRPSGKPLFTIEAILPKGSQTPSRYEHLDADTIVEIEQIKGKANRKPGFDLGKDSVIYKEQGTHGYSKAINEVLKRDEVKRVLEFVISLDIKPLEVEDLQPAMFAISKLRQDGDKWAVQLAETVPGFEKTRRELDLERERAEEEQTRLHGPVWWVVMEDGETLYPRGRTEEEVRAVVAREHPGRAIGSIRVTNPAPMACYMGHGAGCTGFCVPYQSKREPRQNPPLGDIKVRREKKGWHVEARYPKRTMNYGPFKTKGRAMEMREAVIESDLQRNPYRWERRGPVDDLVAEIRAQCSRELGSPPTYDFFNMDYRPGESPDDALLRLFRREWDAQRRMGLNPSLEDIVRTLCHG